MESHQHVPERLEETYKAVIERFANSEEFFKYAQSKHGLKLKWTELNQIREDNKHNSYRQMQCALELWTSYNGEEATPGSLKRTVSCYFDNRIQYDAITANDVPAAAGGFDQPSQPDPSSPQTIHITNITGPIEGPMFMGNESVSFGGSNGGNNASARFDANVPLLKPSATEITTEDGRITVGGAALKYSESTVREPKKISLTYKVDVSETPQDFVRASCLFTCSPTFKSRRPVEVCLPTFCSTDKSVAVSVYKKNEQGQWIFIDDDILEGDNHCYVSSREISNLTLFIPRDRIGDVEYSVACYLFNNADGKFVMGFILDDEAIKSAFRHQVKNQGFMETVNKPGILKVSLGDEISFKISPGQVMPNTKRIVDENFVTGVKGFMYRCTLDKDAVKPRYVVNVFRGDKKIGNYECDVRTGGKSRMETSDGRVGIGIDFLGSPDIGNVVSGVKYAEIDQRTYQDGNGAVRENDKVLFEESDEEKEENQNKPRSATTGTTGTPRKLGGITFHGDPKIGNLVHNAKHVRIDQRNMSRQAHRASIEKLVPAHKPQSDVEQNRSTVVTGSGNGKVEAEPISMDCEKKGIADNAIIEGGNVQVEALPIWKDCEEQARKDRAEQPAQKEQTKQTQRQQHGEKPAGSNEARPISSESSVDSGDEMQSGGSHKGVKEVDVGRSKRKIRQRKQKQEEQPTSAEPTFQKIVGYVPSDVGANMKNGTSQGSLDSFHIILMVMIIFLVFYPLMKGP